MESRRLADLDDERDVILADEEHSHHHETGLSSPTGSTHHNIQVFELTVHTCCTVYDANCPCDHAEYEGVSSRYRNIQVLEPHIPIHDVSADRRRSVAAERAVARSFIVRDSRRYSLVSRRGTVSTILTFCRHLCIILITVCIANKCHLNMLAIPLARRSRWDVGLTIVRSWV